MTAFATHSVVLLLARSQLGVVFLFCALGIASALVIMPTIAPEELNWVLTHIE
jgi:hypothetical protein